VENPVPYYTLSAETLDSTTLKAAAFGTVDLDGDGFANSCDDDIDGDGALNEDDNCPDLPNGPDPVPLTLQEDGFFRVWLVAGPYVKTVGPDRCLPADDDLVAAADADAQPELAGDAGGLVWRAQFSIDARLDYLGPFGFVSPPREVYSAVYLYTKTERTVTLATGPDDGARVWLNDVVVQEISGCQGTSIDRFQTEVTLPEGWSRLMIKVRDQGGGWGNFVRFLDDKGLPITDLELSLSPNGSWTPNQEDTD